MFSIRFCMVCRIFLRVLWYTLYHENLIGTCHLYQPRMVLVPVHVYVPVFSSLPEPSRGLYGLHAGMPTAVTFYSRAWGDVSALWEMGPNCGEKCCWKCCKNYLDVCMLRETRRRTMCCCLNKCTNSCSCEFFSTHFVCFAEEIKIVQKFKYLGVMLTEDMSIVPHVDKV